MKASVGVFVAFLGLGTMAVAQTKATAVSRSVTVSQGGVARWAGNCLRCSFEKQAWKAVEGTCYYPVDMERKPGVYSISRRTTGGKLENAKMTVELKECEKEDITNFTKTEYIDVSAENLARNRKESAVIRPLLAFSKAETAPTFDLPLSKPAKPLAKGTDNFGTCRTFNGQARDRHTGTDYPVTGGESILSVADGTIILAAGHFYSGNSIYIDHGNGLISEYFHLKNIEVKENQAVKKGQKIGTVGDTGRTTGPHLHLGVRWHGARIDPTLLFGDPTNLPDVR
ncbi:M23 family metallopeptidase [Runella sp.]|uniref:M23 family metallopeptidase n=1 Tax=Runella sp. TaxID=1960881 RepID=UPI003D126E44